MIQTDRKSSVPLHALRGGELAVHMPLHPLVEQDQPLVFFAKLRQFPGIWSSCTARPIRPDPDVRILFVNRFVERAIYGIAVEQIAFRGDIIIELRGQRLARSELLETELQESQLQRPDLLVLDILRFRSAGAGLDICARKHLLQRSTDD